MPENKYIDIAPKIVIEIDTKADLSDFDHFMDYFFVKTNKIFEFGTEKVIWILSKNKKTIFAKPHEKWIIAEWTDEIEILDDCKFVLEELLKQDGIY
jgi:hypothetical protein